MSIWVPTNFWRNLHLFLDILELRVKNNNKKLEKIVLVMRSQIHGTMFEIVQLIA